VNFILAFINGLAIAIRSNSKAMGDAGANLASAIVEGMIRGLAGGAGRIASEAKKIAANALNAAKSVLGIHSPSKEFEKVGGYSAEGMANGLRKGSSLIEISAADMGDRAVKSLSGSLANISNLINDKMDVQPVIRPVLDLTNLQNNAGQINKILTGTRQIDIRPVSSSAQAASSGFQNNKDFIAQVDTPDPSRPTIQFVQNNNSPKALSSADIYRQTRNQLSRVKEVVTP
jgi:hypothetical protein